jgi:hypothetical protein
MDKIHINIDKDLKHEAKVKAAKDRVTLTEVICKFLKNWVKGVK